MDPRRRRRRSCSSARTIYIFHVEQASTSTKHQQREQTALCALSCPCQVPFCFSFLASTRVSILFMVGISCLFSLLGIRNTNISRDPPCSCVLLCRICLHLIYMPSLIHSCVCVVKPTVRGVAATKMSTSSSASSSSLLPVAVAATPSSGKLCATVGHRGAHRRVVHLLEVARALSVAVAAAAAARRRNGRHQQRIGRAAAAAAAALLLLRLLRLLRLLGERAEHFGRGGRGRAGAEYDDADPLKVGAARPPWRRPWWVRRRRRRSPGHPTTTTTTTPRTPTPPPPPLLPPATPRPTPRCPPCGEAQGRCRRRRGAGSRTRPAKDVVLRRHRAALALDDAVGARVEPGHAEDHEAEGQKPAPTTRPQTTIQTMNCVMSAVRRAMGQRRSAGRRTGPRPVADSRSGRSRSRRPCSSTRPSPRRPR